MNRILSNASIDENSIFTASLVASITQAVLLGNPDLTFSSVSIDSRTLSKGALFVALKGEKTDGHSFLLSALERGADLFLINQASASPNDFEKLKASGRAILCVEDPLAALQQVAAAHLSRFPHLIRIGITGSSGKTTTKEILGALLKQKYSVCMTEGNLNSGIGLALMALRVKKEDQILLLEMGIDHFGEMDKLASILRPQYALITFIGMAHIGCFGSQTSLASEKGKIFSYFDESCRGYVNKEDLLALGEQKKYRGNFFQYALSEADSGQWQLGKIRIKSLGLKGWLLSIENESVVFPLIGKHNLDNLAAAYSVASDLGIDEKALLDGVKTLKPLFGRNNIQEIAFGKNRLTIIEDCYNANRESVIASLHFFHSIHHEGRKVLLLGSMKELGDESERIHREVGKEIVKSDIDLVFLIGEETFWVYQELIAHSFSGAAYYFENRHDLSNKIKKEKANGDLWLLKGSRSMALEEFESSFSEEENSV